MGNRFVEIISCWDKISLKRLCKTTTVAQEEFVNFILACEQGATHLNHVMWWIDYVPDALVGRDEDWDVLNGDASTIGSKEGQKALRRLFKSHGQRKYKVGHMFISKELQHPIKEWHFIFFEIEELYIRNNHWEAGPHVHITNHLWPGLYCQQVWEDFIVRRKFPSSKLHLAFSDPIRGKA
jgi:hypothetical protein